MCVCAPCECSAWGVGGAQKIPGTDGTDSYNMHCKSWELNQSSARAVSVPNH